MQNGFQYFFLETWVWFLGWEDLLEDGMATHFSIPAWRIPWTGEPGGLHKVAKESDRTEATKHAHTHTFLPGNPGKHLQREEWDLSAFKHSKRLNNQNEGTQVKMLHRTIYKQFSSLQLLSHVWLFATPWIAAHQASLSITNSQSLTKLMPIESVMPSNHLILHHPLFLLPSIFPNIRVFSNESALHIRWQKYWIFSFNISPSNEHPVPWP